MTKTKRDEVFRRQVKATPKPGRRFGVATSWFFLLVLMASVVQAETTMQLTVTAVGGRPILKAYVGVAKETGTWREPVFEELTNKKGGVTFQLDPGDYRVVAAAGGFQSVIVPLTVATNKKHEMKLELAPLTTVVGALVARDGNPVENGRCTLVPRLNPGPSSIRGELWARTLSGDEVILADDRGEFRAKLPADRITPLYCEAPGFSPALRLFRVEEPLTIVLEPGGQLTLKSDRVEPGFIVELSAVTETAVPLNWQPRVWSRSVDHSSIAFDSLGPGTYRITGRYADALRFVTSEELGTATVEAGGHSEIKFTVPEAKPRVSEYTSIHIRNKGPLGVANLQGFAASQGEEPARVAHSIEVTAGGVAVILDAGEETLSYLTSSESIVTRAYDDRLEPGEGRIFRKAQATIQFLTENEMPLPRAGSIELRDCPQKERVRLPIQVNNSGFSRLEVPAPCGSMIFRFEGYGATALSASLTPDENACLETDSESRSEGCAGTWSADSSRRGGHRFLIKEEGVQRSIDPVGGWKDERSRCCPAA